MNNTLLIVNQPLDQIDEILSLIQSDDKLYAKYANLHLRLLDVLNMINKNNSITVFCQELLLINTSAVGLTVVYGMLLFDLFLNHPDQYLVMVEKHFNYYGLLTSYHQASGLTEFTRDWFGTNTAVLMFPYYQNFLENFYYLIDLPQRTPLRTPFFVLYFIIVTMIDFIQHGLVVLNHTLFFPLFGGFHSLPKIMYHVLHWIILMSFIPLFFSDQINKKMITFAEETLYASYKYERLGHTFRSSCCLKK
jgi:hypothetical protein